MARAATTDYIGDNFLEASDRILLRATEKASTADELLQDTDALERRFLLDCRTPKQKSRLVHSVAGLRLAIMQITRQPLERCLPFADRVIQLGVEAPLACLAAMGSFARYAQKGGCSEVGTRYLRAALDGTDWTKMRSKNARLSRADALKILDDLAQGK